MCQGAKEWTATIYVDANENLGNLEANQDTSINGYVTTSYVTNGSLPTIASDLYIENDVSYKKIVFSASPQTNTGLEKQLLVLDKYYYAHRIDVTITKWSVGNTPTKVMFLSNDIQILAEGREIGALTILEEKVPTVEMLSYGITANSCSVSVRNTGNRFVSNRDLLKKNRIVKPFLKEKAQDEWSPMGKFYTDSWEVPSNSDYVTCKAYDMLYNLQKMYITYPMELDSDGYYCIDKNKSAKAVYEKIFALINAQRKASGIFGADMNVTIDGRLADHNIEYVCLGYDTAWNMLQQMANATCCFIYADRNGDIVVQQDDFTSFTGSTSGAEITPSNSFTYNLPTMSQSVVNRVIAPYCELVEGAPDDDVFEVKVEDMVIVNDQYHATIELLNFHERIIKIETSHDSKFLTSEVLAYSAIVSSACNRLVVNLGGDYAAVTYIKVNEGDCSKIQLRNYDINNYASQKSNGIVEIKLENGNLMWSRNQCEQIGSKITNKYGAGLNCIESDWVGNVGLYLGDSIDSYSIKDEETVTYELLSNEFTYDGGLRSKTRAREIDI